MGKYVVGIDIGGTNIKVGILKKSGEIIKSYSMKTQASKGSEDVLERIKEQVEEILKENDIDKKDVHWIS